MIESDREITIILRVCMAICILIGLFCMAGSAMALFSWSIAAQTQSTPSLLIAAIALFLLGALFFSSIIIRKKKISVYFFAILGLFLFVSYTVASFASLFKVGNPSMEFIILGALACTGLWLLLAAVNPAVRKSFDKKNQIPS